MTLQPKRRWPNPWVAIPSGLVGLVAGILGWVVTDLSCTTSDPPGAITPCPGWAWLVAVGAFLTVTIGMALVLVLVFRSLAEWREKSSC